MQNILREHECQFKSIIMLDPSWLGSSLIWCAYLDVRLKLCNLGFTGNGAFSEYLLAKNRKSLMQHHMSRHLPQKSKKRKLPRCNALRFLCFLFLPFNTISYFGYNFACVFYYTRITWWWRTCNWQLLIKFAILKGCYRRTETP